MPHPDAIANAGDAGSPADEAGLMQQVVAGDAQAFETLYTRYAPRLRSFLRRRLGQHDLVEDVLNETMLALWQHAARFDPTQRLSAWIWSITRHKAGKAQWAIRPQPELPSFTPAENDQNNPENHLIRQERAGAMARALAQLPMHQRAVVTWAYYEHATYQDMAQRLGCSVHTVKTRLGQARRRLAVQVMRTECRPGTSAVPDTSPRTSQSPAQRVRPVTVRW
jgi:RNA polymerase sigma-70 factor (ECF subfamily)